MEKYNKIILWNILIVGLNILCFSNKFIGMDINCRDEIIRGISQSIVFFSIVIAVYINKDLAIKGISYIKNMNSTSPIKYPKKQNLKDIKKVSINSVDNKDKKICIKKLKNNKSKNIFKMIIKCTLRQINRISKKIGILQEIITIRFNKGDISYNNLMDSIEEIESIFYFNIIQIVHKLEAYDEEEYLDFKEEISAIKLQQNKEKIYSRYKQDIEQSILANEEILMKLDELIIEFSDLVNSKKTSDGNGVPIVTKKVDQLIQIAKYYK